MKRSTLWMAAGFLVARSALALPVDATGQDIPVTDSALLEQLGYEPEAGNVYATPQAYQELLMDPAERAALQEARPAEHDTAQESSAAGGSFGTADVGYTPIDYTSFTPRILITRDATSTPPTEYSRSGGGMWCVTGIDDYQAELHLPHGTKLESLDIWYFDNFIDAGGNDNVRVVLTRRCYPDFTGGLPTNTLLGVSQSAGAVPEIRFASIADIDDDVDLLSCSYVVTATMGFNCAGGSALRIHKVRAQWRRQVSPPPATATFGDVPTGHPFFQHIEALVASGITSGCGGDDFCPNGSLTRGQMAVFLAKALGLHWSP